MLKLTRRDGEWIEVTHRSGDVMWIRAKLRRFTADGELKIQMEFDDAARHFLIERPERNAESPRVGG